jgi:methionyl-tRNA formyltransferase
MRIIFAGTPAFAAASLKKLLASQHEVVLVLSQPDRPAGRGRKLKASEVKELAVLNSVPVYTPESLSLKKGGEEALQMREILRQADADILVVAAYGLIIPKDILELPKGAAREGLPPLKAINVHGSLLPAWRGAAPIARGIQAQNREAGVTLMEMEATLDTGAMLYRKARPLTGTETAGELTEELAETGADMLVEYLNAPSNFSSVKQDDAAATYANKLEKSEGALDFSKSAGVLSAQIRAFNPYPGTTFALDGAAVKAWNARVSEETTNLPPGTVISTDSQGNLKVACGENSVLLLTELQKAGGKKLTAKQFLTGNPVPKGTRLA